MEKIMENLPSYLFYFCIFFLPAILTLVITLKATGWKRLLSWGHFALLVLPLAIAGGGGMILSAQGLSWRSCVKLPCGFAYVAGVTLLLLQAAAFLWRKIAWWRPVARGVGRCAIFAAGAFLCLTLTWYGLIFSAIWAGRDRRSGADLDRLGCVRLSQSPDPRSGAAGRIQLSKERRQRRSSFFSWNRLQFFRINIY